MNAKVRTAHYLEQLDQILSLTREMLALARQGEWGLLAEADHARQAVIGSLGEVNGLALPSGDPSAWLIRERLKAILEMNDEMTRLGRELCQTLSRRILNITEGRNARRAYLENCR